MGSMEWPQDYLPSAIREISQLAQEEHEHDDWIDGIYSIAIGFISIGWRLGTEYADGTTEKSLAAIEYGRMIVDYLAKRTRHRPAIEERLCTQYYGDQLNEPRSR